MPNLRKTSEAALRYQERRQREEQAPRLTTEVPDLLTLDLDLSETSTQVASGVARHVRRIQVEHAPALFLFPCGDPQCRDGGHDLTREIMRDLARHAPTFEGDDSCRGAIGPNQCSRVLHYAATATYR
jgi:hypothetical protein